VSFWPTVTFAAQGSETDEQGYCNFCFEENFSTKMPEMLPFPYHHSVMEEADFCSVWEAQNKALLLAEALRSTAFDVDFDKQAKTWVTHAIADDFAMTSSSSWPPCIVYTSGHPIGHVPAGTPETSGQGQHGIRRDRPLNRPPLSAEFPAWIHHVWQRLLEEGVPETDDEGPVCYINSYYISHLTAQRQEHGRPVRFNGNFRNWQREVPLVGADQFDPNRDYEVIFVVPEPPVTVQRDTVGTILVIQHPDETRAACLTTAWIPDVPTFQTIQIAHSFRTTIDRNQLLLHGGVLELCNDRSDRGFGVCRVCVGRIEYPLHRPVRIHDGLGLMLDVPPPMPPQEWENYLVERIRLQATEPPRFFEEDEDALNLMARSHTARFNTGGRGSEVSGDDMLTSDSGTGTSSLTSDPYWQAVRVFTLDRQEVDLEVPWHDGRELYHRVARHFRIDPSQVDWIYTIAHGPDDLTSNDQVGLLLRQRHDLPAAAILRLTLVDVEYKQDRFGPATLIDRRARWIPRRITRSSLIRLLGYDGHCSADPPRCWLWIDNTRVPFELPPEEQLRITHGDYIRLAVPAFPDRPLCDTGENPLPPDLNATHDLMLAPVDDTQIDVNATEIFDGVVEFGIVTMNVEPEDGAGLLQLDVNTHHLGPQHEQNPPSFHSCSRSNLGPVTGGPELQRPDRHLHDRWAPLREVWNQPTLQVRGLQNEPVMHFETWYLSSRGFARCSTSRRVALGDDFHRWIAHLRSTWRDRVNPRRPAELIIAQSSTIGEPGGGHLILTQDVTNEERATLISVYWTSHHRLQDRSAELVSRRFSRDDVLQQSELHLLCRLGRLRCRVAVGVHTMDADEVWPIQPGTHFDIFTDTPFQQEVFDINEDQVNFMQYTNGASTTTTTLPRPNADQGCAPFLFNAAAPAWSPTVPAITTMHETVQDLYALWRDRTFSWEGEERTGIVITWYVDQEDPERRLCNRPRSVRLTAAYYTWEHQIQQAWQDTLIAHEPCHFAIVSPAPPHMEPEVVAHIILVQRPADALCTSLLTIYDHTIPQVGTTQQIAMTTHEHIFLEQLIHSLGRTNQCLMAGATQQCQAWYGSMRLTLGTPLQGRDGYGLVLLFSMRPPATAGMTMLQTRASRKRAVDERLTHGQVAHTHGPQLTHTLCLEELIEGPGSTLQLVPYRLIWATLSPERPNGLFLADGAMEHEVEQALADLHFPTHAYQMGCTGKFFCVPMTWNPSDDEFHYIYVNPHDTEAESAFLHTEKRPLQELDHMQLLHRAGYTRAVILDTKNLRSHLTRILYHNNSPTLEHMTHQHKSKHANAWPLAQVTTTVGPMIDLQQLPSRTPSMVLEIDVELIQSFFHSATDILCPWFSHLDLPETTRIALAGMPTDPDWDKLDRLIVYTDGSSQGQLRRRPPLWAEEHASTDAWAFLVLGERYARPDEEGVLYFIGWQAHNVVYRTDTTHHLGTSHLGSEHAEREGMFWAGLWRLACNSTLPTIFRPDSLTTAQQAMGDSGTNHATAAYVALRSTFQALQSGLGDGLQVDPVRSHMNEPWNDMVDFLAKHQAQHDQKLTRQDVDLRRLQPFLPYFWMLLDKRSGLPELGLEGFEVTPPDLPPPCRPSTAQQRDPVTGIGRFDISLLSVNVMSLYKGPDGVSGKLHYLRRQVMNLNFNFVGIQEARSEAGKSCVDNLIRFASGADNGQLGVELWINLNQPFIRTTATSTQVLHFDTDNFQVVHADPRRLLVRVSHPNWKCLLFVGHGPHTGRPDDERSHWWTETTALVRSYRRGMPVFAFLDANARTGPSAPPHILEIDDMENANTAPFREFLYAHYSHVALHEQLPSGRPGHVVCPQRRTRTTH